MYITYANENVKVYSANPPTFYWIADFAIRIKPMQKQINMRGHQMITFCVAFYTFFLIL